MKKVSRLFWVTACFVIATNLYAVDLYDDYGAFINFSVSHSRDYGAATHIIGTYWDRDILRVNDDYETNAWGAFLSFTFKYFQLGYTLEYISLKPFHDTLFQLNSRDATLNTSYASFQGSLNLLLRYPLLNNNYKSLEFSPLAGIAWRHFGFISGFYPQAGFSLYLGFIYIEGLYNFNLGKINEMRSSVQTDISSNYSSASNITLQNAFSIKLGISLVSGGFHWSESSRQGNISYGNWVSSVRLRPWRR